MLTSFEIEQLQVIIARASAPGERSAGGHFAPLSGASVSEQAKRREDEWRECACRGDRSRFERLLADRGIRPDEVLPRLAAVVLRDPAELPGWGATLLDLLAQLAAAAASGAPAPGCPPELAPALAPICGLGAAFLHDQATAAPAILSAGAERDLVGHLARRLVQSLGPTLAHRPALEEALDGFHDPQARTVHEIFFPVPPDPSRSPAAGWIALLSRYPVAGRLLATVYRQWCRYTTLLRERAARDRPRLEARISPATPLGTIESIAAGAGDVHEDGASVALVRFSSGARVLYKPRDLRVAARFQDLVEELNAARPSLPLHRRAVLAGDGYAWEEFVERSDCASGEEVARYYRRLGMLLGLLQWLEGRDFSADNVLACGEHPVLIDLEGLLAARPVSPASDLPEATREAERALAESPAHTGILPVTQLGEPGRPGLDQSVLARPGLHPVPFRRPGRDALAVQIRGAPATLDGQPVDPGPYLEEIQSGFAEMRALLARERERLAGPDGFLQSMADVPVRHYHRDTTFYARLLELSLDPQLLTDGVERELHLERLWRAYFSAPQPPELIQEEVDALRRLDIPLFQSRPGRDALVLPGGREVGGVFAGTALERARRRLERPPGEALLADAEVIASVFATRRAFPGERVVRPAAPRTAGPPASDWLAVAASIGDEILAPAIHGGDGSIAWLGLAYHPPCDLWRLEPLGIDVLAGAGGLALVLAELHRATGGHRFRAAAERIFAGMPVALAEISDELGQLPPSGPFAPPPPLYTGAFYGLGAPIYTLTRCARLLGRPDLDRLAAGFARSLPLDRIRERSPLDAVSGRAGLVLALVDARDPDPPCWRLDLALAITAAAEVAEPGPSPYPRGSTYLDCLPGVTASIALAQRRLAPGESGFPDPEPVTPGDLLALLLGSEGRAAPATLAAADAATASPADSLASPDLLLALQVALAGARAGEGAGAAATFRGRAEDLGREMRWRRAEHGSWFPDLAAADRHHLSAVRGLGAVALAMLELHQPGAPLGLAAVE